MAELAVLRCVRPWRVAVMVSVGLLLAAAAVARAAVVSEDPVIVGDPTPGFQLTASPGQWTPSSAAATYDWLRCDAAGVNCVAVAGSCERKYTVRDADLDHTLRARLTVDEPGQERVFAVSEPTELVVVKTYSITTPGDAGAACVQVTSTGPGAGTFISGGATGPGTTPAPDTSRPFIDPFPVVRIGGRFKGPKTKLTRVTVSAPRATRIRVGCKGRGCPYRRKAFATKLRRVGSLQRTYRPKATIEIRVTQSRKIGKYTRIRTRRGKAPVRIDRCLMPGKTKPVKCPRG